MYEIIGGGGERRGDENWEEGDKEIGVKGINRAIGRTWGKEGRMEMWDEEEEKGRGGKRMKGRGADKRMGGWEENRARQ